MNRSAIARRYGPLVLLAAVQLVIILLLPSTAPATQRVTADTSGRGPGGAAGATAAGGGVAGPSADGTSGYGGQTSGGGGALESGGVGPGAGDTSHCVAGRQFDPTVDFFAPPCIGKWAGGDNGGETYQGVTA